MQLPSLGSRSIYAFYTILGVSGAVAGTYLIYQPLEMSADRRQESAYESKMAEELLGEAEEALGEAEEAWEGVDSIPSRLANADDVDRYVEKAGEHARRSLAHLAAVDEMWDSAGRYWITGGGLLLFGVIYLRKGWEAWETHQEKQDRLLELQISLLEEQLADSDGGEDQDESDD